MSRTPIATSACLALSALVIGTAWSPPSAAAFAPGAGDERLDSGQDGALEGCGVRLASGRVRYTVVPGDTLSEIAREFDVSVEDIRRWNDLEGDLIRVGQVLTIRTRSRYRGRERVDYEVQRGDTISEIANEYGVTVSDVVRWNRGIHPDRIREGQEIRLYLPIRRSGSSEDVAGDSTSIGRPQRGRLRSSEQLRSGPGYRVRTPSRAYGTNEAVEFINRVFARLHQRYPEAPTLAIGDLSYRRGGRMRPHISHQSGRDADIAYYTAGREDDDGFVLATPENLDVPLTWYLLKSFIDTEAVQYVFVDYDLQAVLYEYVERRGATREELEQWFQYPREDATAGLLRHSRGHDDHFHIRFRCPRSDERCRD